jgi:hypothetical protein
MEALVADASLNFEKRRAPDELAKISRILGFKSRVLLALDIKFPATSVVTRDVCETLMPPLDIHYRVHNPLFWA